MKSQVKKNKTEPIICGIDIGSWTVKIGYYDGQKFQILSNQANFRETPSLVAFTSMQRMIGQPANIRMKTNFANTIRSPMRLIGLGKTPHILQQQLKYSTVNYDLDPSIEFKVTHGDKQLQLQPQQILIALMCKVKQIVEHNNFHIYASYIAIPSYLTNSQRTAVKKCAQVIKLGQVHLLDDWVAIASEYSYFRIKQLVNQYQRNVLFIDVGYSKFSIYAVQFNPNKCKLIDYQHLKYTGSKNMDNYLTQFYDDLFYKNTQSDQKIIHSNKALIKLRQMIDKQRKVLSANSQHHLNIQYIINEDDLSYNMKRQQFQNIIMPVLSQMATALSNINSRLGPKMSIHAIQLIGGASRIPLIQQIVSNNFQINVSKTLNTSQSMARGSSIFGAIQTGFINFPYQICTQQFTAVSVVWNSVKKENYLGQNPKVYPNKKTIFDWGCRYPCQNSINLGPQGIVQLYIHYEHEITSQSIGYLRVTTPSKVIFYLDQDKIISAKCNGGNILIYNFHQIKQQKWHKMQQMQKKFQQNDKRIVQIYNMKNQYQSLIYKIKQNISSDWSKFISKQLKLNIQEMLIQSQKWIQVQNQKKKHSEQDVKDYTNRIQQLNSFIQVIRNRKRNYEEIQHLYRQFMEKAKLKNVSSPLSKKQLQNLVTRVQDAYINMERNLFDTEDLKPADLAQATRNLSRIM